jgi:uncharacterized protein YyaL (SSP411 family)
VGERALDAFSRKIAAGPSGLPQMLVTLLFRLSTPRQVVLAGDRTEIAPMLAEFRRRFLPFHTLLWAGSTSLNSELANMPAADDRATAYVCENFACELPVNEEQQFAALLQ